MDQVMAFIHGIALWQWIVAAVAGVVIGGGYLWTTRDQSPKPPSEQE